MKFGDLPIDDALGAILAHKFYDAAGKLVFNKGHVLKHADLALLRERGLAQVTVTQLSDADLHEDIAAERIGKAVAGTNVRWRTPGVGRANLTSTQRGVLHVDVPKLELDQQYLRWHHHRHPSRIQPGCCRRHGRAGQGGAFRRATSASDRC